jgi:Lrp/AsnC family leucine-responsive transcriptional regulator
MKKKHKNPKTLDRTDRRILECLQADGRISNVQLARKVNLTPTPCIERVKRLERQGYIRGYTIHPMPSGNSVTRRASFRRLWIATWYPEISTT